MKQLVNLCLLVMFVMHQANGFCLFAQTDPSRRNDRSNQIEERIKRVENNLLPAVRIKGETTGNMNILQRMQHHNVAGVSVAVINNGKIEWAKGYGVREAGTAVPVTTETLFQAASISKPVSAFAALKMVQDSKLDLDKDVNSRLVSWKVPENEFTKDQKVTLRRLLSHTAGLSVSGFAGYPADTKSLPDVRQILEGSEPANSKPVRVIETPGVRVSYSGGGFTVMQLLMTEASGKSFPQLMSETVLKKLGMTHSTFEQPLPQNLQQQAAVAHGPKGEVPAFKWFVYPEMAAAGLWTTPSDLARFAIELQQAYAGKSRNVLSPEMANQMLTKQPGGWGLGVELAGEGGNAFRFLHSGSNKGFRTAIVMYTQIGQGAVVMANSDQGAPLVGEILRGIASEYGWSEYLEKEKTVVTVDPKTLAGYVGDYEFPGRGKYTVLFEADKLFLSPNSGAKFELFPESETKFFIKERPGQIVFVQDATGRTTEMVIFVNGQEIHLKRL